MTKEEALNYCYKHEKEYIVDTADTIADGQRQFDCLIAILEDGTISPSELPDYGMDY